MRLLTKEQRNKSRLMQFDLMLKNGWVQETYKGLEIFTKNEGKYYTLKIFRGNASNHLHFVNYNTEQRRIEIIANFKTNYDSSELYKIEQKEKNKGYKSNQAAAAAAIKKELKAKYPNTKFYVTSESFAGGDSVHIRWTDGETTTQVNKIVNKYQYGHFNGMEDIYEYTNEREDIPQTKYVSTSRKLSEDINKEVTRQLLEKRIYTDEELTNYRNSPEEQARRILYKTEIPLNYTKLNLIFDEASNEFKIIFELAPQPEPTKIHDAKQTETANNSGISIIAYSDKSFAIFGETKPIKEDLKKLGGKFNPHLSCGAGWIFSNKRKQDVTRFLNI